MWGGCFNFPEDPKGKGDKYLAAVPSGRATLLFCNTEKWTKKELLDLAEAVKNLATHQARSSHPGRSDD